MWNGPKSFVTVKQWQFLLLEPKTQIRLLKIISTPKRLLLTNITPIKVKERPCLLTITKPVHQITGVEAAFFTLKDMLMDGDAFMETR